MDPCRDSATQKRRGPGDVGNGARRAIRLRRIVAAAAMATAARTIRHCRNCKKRDRLHSVAAGFVFRKSARSWKTTTRCVLIRRSARPARIQWSSAASGSRAIPTYPASNAGRAWKSSPKRMSLGSARSAAYRSPTLSGPSAPCGRRKKSPSRYLAEKVWPKKFGYESDREPTAIEFCATLPSSQTPTLVPTGPHPGGTFFFVCAASSARDPARGLLRKMRSQW